MAQYYYTVASLPMLAINQDPPITSEYFLETCRYTLNEKDYQLITEAVLMPQDAQIHPAIEKWHNWERSFRNELVKMRASKIDIDADKYLQEGESTTGVFDAAREAFNAANPKIAEDIIDGARWRYLDELESGHEFDMTKLVIYYLKLQIAERKKNMNVENGEKNYKEIYNDITEKIHQSYDGEL